MSRDEFLDSVKARCDGYIKELDSKSVLELFSALGEGKMLRSKLIFAIAGGGEESCKLASIIELIHLASLLHDDVIDDALTRRGLSTINASYGNKSAIMLGDILYSKAFYELSKGDREISLNVSSSVVKLSIGELLDVELTKSFNDNEEIYFDMIYKKTASLIESSAKCAALLAKKDDIKLGNYAKNLGIAFQIVDDILDITQDSKKLGKPALNDLKEGKSTLPYIILYKKLGDIDKNRLKCCFKRELEDFEIRWVKEKLDKTNSLKESKEVAFEFAKRAIENAGDDLHLVEIVEKMIQREY